MNADGSGRILFVPTCVSIWIANTKKANFILEGKSIMIIWVKNTQNLGFILKGNYQKLTWLKGDLSGPCTLYAA